MIINNFIKSTEPGLHHYIDLPTHGFFRDCQYMGNCPTQSGRRGRKHYPMIRIPRPSEELNLERWDDTPATLGLQHFQAPWGTSWDIPCGLLSDISSLHEGTNHTVYMAIIPSGKRLQFANLKMAIESSLIYPLKMVMFHSYVTF